MMLIFLLTCWAMCVGTAAYPYGPPASACTSMFPKGHKVDAQTSPPPYELTVSPTTLTRPEQMFTVTLRVKPNPDYKYFKGLFVQARMITCDVEKSLGTFMLPNNADGFLRTMKCGDRPMSAVTHNFTKHVEDFVTFQWKAPTSEPGHIYFRATVVKNATTFWTNVFSQTVEDLTDRRVIKTAPQCDVCSTQLACSASTFTSTVLLVLTALALPAVGF